jgi:hypothetical protein
MDKLNTETGEHSGASLCSAFPWRPQTLADNNWREDFRCYGSQWGYEPGSPVCNLIDFVRDEYRAKYGSDYRLVRVDAEKYQVDHGRKQDGSECLYGEEFLLEHAPRFGVIILPNGKDDPR